MDDSDDSEVIGRRGKGGRRNKRMEPVRRSTRARITRFDKEFSKSLQIKLKLFSIGFQQCLIFVFSAIS